jgi:hypothetical protein
MDILKMLYNMHVSITLNKPPFTHIIKNLSNDDIDLNKLNSINNDNIISFSKICFEKFVERYPRCLKGSVHVNSYVWTEIAIKTLKTNITNKKENIFVFPNGCCSLNKCSINLYYEIVVEELLKEKHNINNDEDIKNEYGKK